MGTPGLRLIQDLLAKSVAKWGGDIVKSTEEEKTKDIKIETGNIKVEYIETETDLHDVKTEQEEINDDNSMLKVQVDLKRKLEDTDKSRKKKKKANNRSKFANCDDVKDFLKTETDENEAPDQKEDKSLIKRLLINSANKFTETKEEHEKFLSKNCKNETKIKTEIIFSSVLGKEDLVPTADKHQDDERHSMTGIQKKTRIKKTAYKRVGFSPVEDEILQHAIDSDNINFPRLAKDLGRSDGSIHTRILRLKNSDGKGREVRKSFSLVEDMLIMDKMLDKLSGKRLKDLKMHGDDLTPEFLTSLRRKTITTPMNRWNLTLRTWILQYYAGTLNLDIKRQLANYLADTFAGFDSIDWSVVAERPEFAGHTEASLKHLLHSQLFRSTKGHQNLEPSEVTLRNIVENTNMKHVDNKKVPEITLTRQMQVIGYFEQYVKKHGITNFL